MLGPGGLCLISLCFPYTATSPSAPLTHSSATYFAGITKRNCLGDAQSLPLGLNMSLIKTLRFAYGVAKVMGVAFRGAADRFRGRCLRSYSASRAAVDAYGFYHFDTKKHAYIVRKGLLYTQQNNGSKIYRTI